MQRSASIEALIRKSRESFAGLKGQYEASLNEKAVREDLKVDIKNIFENLRSCLDYIAQELFDAFCAGAKKPDRLYFPIRHSASEFEQVISRDYPFLAAKCRAAFDIVEAIQPYHDPWLGEFNGLNNENKHQDLVEQTRTESRRVEVKRAGQGSSAAFTAIGRRRVRVRADLRARYSGPLGAVEYRGAQGSDVSGQIRRAHRCASAFRNVSRRGGRRAARFPG